MLKTKNHGKHILIAICSFLFIMTSCETTRNISVVPQEPTLLTYNEDKNVVIDDKTFLFIRTYDPHYNNPLYKQNILKGLINLVAVNDVAASHVSLGFSLEDDFWGLTSNKGDGINKNLTREQCTDTTTNPYMEKCDMEKSWQTTYALLVTKEEFDKALKLTEKYANDPKMKYSVKKILQISGFELKRRFFTAKENRNIKTLKPRKGSFINNKDEKEFHCASFVAYVLINSVENIKDFFDSRELNYNQLSPSDITQIPGIHELFSSIWGDYNKVAEKFIEEQADTYIERILGQQ